LQNLPLTAVKVDIFELNRTKMPPTSSAWADEFHGISRDNFPCSDHRARFYFDVQVYGTHFSFAEFCGIDDIHHIMPIDGTNNTDHSTRKKKMGVKSFDQMLDP
jgi:hypothetical protein